MNFGTESHVRKERPNGVTQWVISLDFKLTHWGRVTHICVSKLSIIGSDNGLSPDRCEAIIWTNAGILLIGPLGTNFSEILIKILTFSFKKMCLKVSSAKRQPFCLGLNVLNTYQYWMYRNKRENKHITVGSSLCYLWNWAGTASSLA